MKIIDTHNDFLTVFANTKERQNYLAKAAKRGVKMNASVFTTELKNDPMTYIEKCRQDVPGRLHIEDLFFVNPTNLQRLLKIKPFACGLTWNSRNSLAGGVKSKAGLTKWGKKVVQELEDNDILIDTAHLNEKSFWQLKSITKNPLYNSHTGFYDMCPHPRNLRYEQIKAIVDSGGFIGLCFVTYFLSKNNTSMDIVCDNIQYFVQNFGTNHLGIGTDFFGTTKLPDGLKDYTGFSALQKALQKKGFSQSVIKKFFYQNFEDFLLANKKIKL